MKPLKKKGFTIVEVVIVIAVIAVLAAVLIPTFSSVVEKANESAYLQEKTNQQIMDALERIENEDYFGWDEFEEQLAGLTEGSSEAAIRAAVEAAISEYNAKLHAGNSGLTEEQIRKILEHTLKDLGLSKEKIRDILDGLLGQIGAINVTGVTVNPTTLTVPALGTESLTANVLPANATNQAVTWSSADTGIATVDSATGVVTGVKPGTTTVTATTADGGKTATCTVTVTEPEVSTAADLVAALTGGASAKLTGNVELGRWDVLLLNGNNVVLDLNGHTLTNFQVSDGTLEIKGDGSVTATSYANVNAGATLKINSDFTANTKVYVKESGTLEINDSNFTASNGIEVAAGGVMNITDSQFTITSSVGVYGSMKIDGGSEVSFNYGVNVHPGANLTVKNSSMSTSGKVEVKAGATLSMDHVVVTNTYSSDNESVRNYGNATITNSSFETKNTSTAKLLVNYGTMSLSNCELTSTTKTTNDKTFVISNNTYPTTNPDGADLTLTNVTVTAKYGCVANTDSDTSDTCKSTVTISGGNYTTKTFQSSEAPVFNTRKNTLTLKDNVQIYAQDGGAGITAGVVGTADIDYKVHIIQ